MKKKNEFIVLLLSLIFLLLSGYHIYYEFTHSYILKYLKYSYFSDSDFKIHYEDFSFSTNFIYMENISVEKKESFSFRANSISLYYNPANMLAYLLRMGHPRISMNIDSCEAIMKFNNKTSSSKMDFDMKQLISRWFKGDILINNLNIINNEDTLSSEIWLRGDDYPVIKGGVSFPKLDSLRFDFSIFTDEHSIEISKKNPTTFLFNSDDFLISDKTNLQTLINDLKLNSKLTENGEWLLNGHTDFHQLIYGDKKTITIPKMELSLTNNQLSSSTIAWSAGAVSMKSKIQWDDIFSLSTLKMTHSYHSDKLNHYADSITFNTNLAYGDSIEINGEMDLFSQSRRHPFLYQISLSKEGKITGFDIKHMNGNPIKALIWGNIENQEGRNSIEAIMESSGSLRAFNKLHPFLKEMNYSINGKIDGVFDDPEFKIKASINHPRLEIYGIPKLNLSLEGVIDSFHVNSTDSSHIQIKSAVKKTSGIYLSSGNMMITQYPIPFRMENLNYPDLSANIDFSSVQDSFSFKGNFSLKNKDSLNTDCFIDGYWKQKGKTLEMALQTEKCVINELPYKIISEIKINDKKQNFLIHLDSSLINLSIDQDSLQGIVDFNFLPFTKIRYIYSKINFLKDLKGLVKGKFQIRGEKMNPQIDGNIKLYDGSFRYARKLYLNTRFELKNKQFNFYDGELLAGEDIIAQSEHFMISKDTLTGEINGSAVDAYYLPLAYSWLEDKVKGSFSYKMTLSGKFKNPYIHWKILGINGDFWYFYFDKLDLDLVFHNHFLSFPSYQLTRDNEYVINGKGIVYNVFGDSKAWRENMGFTFQFDNYFNGNLLSLVPRLRPDEYHKGKGFGEGRIKFSGDNDTIYFNDIHGRIKDGALYPKLITEEINHINGEFYFDSVENFIHFPGVNAKIDGRDIRIYNTNEIKSQYDSIKKLPPFEIRLENLRTYLGYFFIESDWIKINIPGIMNYFNDCRVRLEPKYDLPYFLVAGPFPTANIIGTISGKDLEFFYPPDEVEGMEKDSLIIDILRYDLFLKARQNVWFRNNFANIKIEDNTVLSVKGQFMDSSIVFNGTINLSEGTVSYMRKDFSLQNASIEFSGYDILTTVTGKAIHTYYDTELNREITLEIVPYFIDPISNRQQNRGKIEDIRWRFISDKWNDLDENNSDIASSIGAKDNYRMYAAQLVFSGMHNMFINQYLQFLEASIKKSLPFVDYFRINSNIINTLLLPDSDEEAEIELNKWNFLANSRITVGKYLTPRLFLTYTGTVVSNRIEFEQSTLNLRHQFGFEYRLYRSLFLNMKFHYDPEINETDRRIQVFWHHSFSF